MSVGGLCQAVGASTCTGPGFRGPPTSLALFPALCPPDVRTALCRGPWTRDLQLPLPGSGQAGPPGASLSCRRAVWTGISPASLPSQRGSASPHPAFLPFQPYVKHAEKYRLVKASSAATSQDQQVSAFRHLEGVRCLCGCRLVPHPAHSKGASGPLLARL